jgi:hypothetical protein
MSADTAPTPPKLEYVFTMQVEVDPLIGGRDYDFGTRDFPAGTCLYLAYKGAVKGPRIDGEIATSGDWGLLRNDGVLQLDARLSIATNDGSAIAARMEGMTDPILGAVKARLSASLRFEVSGAAPPDAAKRYINASKNHEKYRELGQAILFGFGEVTLQPPAVGSRVVTPTSLKLDVFKR